MSWAWEREYENRVGSILKSVDPTGPLFSEDTFMAECDGEAAQLPDAPEAKTPA
jgi:hypothetical protein